MSVPFFDLTRQYRSIRQELDAAISRVLDSQHFIMGPEVEAFEAEMAEQLDGMRALGVASGTDALLLALQALEPSAGEEVIVPSFTFFATAGAVWNSGFRPVFCDVDPDTFNVTAATLDAAWTKKTRAAIPVHLFGQMAPMAEIVEWAESKGVFLIEDVAQAIGAKQRIGEHLRRAGTVGDVGAFSFFPTKNLGAFGDAGMVSVREGALADRIADSRTHGGRRMYHHEFVGTNSRLDALQAAVLRVKALHLGRWIEARRENARTYRELLADIGGLKLPTVIEGNHHTYNQFTVLTTRRDELRDALRGRGIGTGLYYPLPMHRQICFQSLGYEEGSLPVAERLCREVVSLPIFPELRPDEIEEVATAVHEFFREGR